MPRIFTTDEGVARAKRQIRYLLIAAGLQNKLANEDLPSSFNYNSYLANAKVICDELVNRDFTNIDNAINGIQGYLPRQNRAERSFKSTEIAKIIVFAAELLQLYWDDTLKTPYEIDEFKKTLLGEAVFKYGRYISAIQDKRTSNRVSRNNSSNTNNTTSTVTNTAAPKNNYKSSGPQSGNVRNLLDLDGVSAGTPGQKVVAQGKYIYRIIGDNPQSKNIPNVFIKPLSASGATGNTNKIFISSGNGYTDCTCYFDDQNDAQLFLDKIIAANRVPSNITNLRVVGKHADPNGYFLVGTEFGPVAISAKTLNEACDKMTEAANCGWEKATQNYTTEELNELHTWMRRD